MFLEGIKVVDIGSFVAAPAAATAMADFGADVVKIEPLDGDPYRGLLGLLTTEYPNFFWELDSRNKKSLAIDITTSDGRSILERLIDGADVVVTNYRPDLLARLRLTYEDVSAIKPDIIYGQVNSFGLEGADADRTGFDATAWWARSGLMDYVRGAGANPAVSSPGMGDHPTSMALFGGIMGALYRREKTGQGAHVHTSLLANGAWAHSMVIQGALVGFDTTERRTPEDVKMIPLATTYRTADDRVLLMCILNPDKEWAGFMRALDAPAIAADERFADTPTRTHRLGRTGGHLPRHHPLDTPEGNLDAEDPARTESDHQNPDDRGQHFLPSLHIWSPFVPPSTSRILGATTGDAWSFAGSAPWREVRVPRLCRRRLRAMAGRSRPPRVRSGGSPGCRRRGRHTLASALRRRW